MTVIFSYHSFSNRNAMLAVATEVDPLVDGNAPVVRINTADIIDIGAISIPAELPPNWQPDDVVPAPRVLDGYWLCAAWRGGIPDAFLASSKPRPEQAPSFGQALGEDYLYVGQPGDEIPKDAVVLVPPSVTNFQMRAALSDMPMPHGGSLFDAVDDAIQAGKVNSTAGMLAWQAWEYANEITRYGATVETMATAFGFNDTQLDDLFRAASTIQA
jgi:hypothetical protein